MSVVVDTSVWIDYLNDRKAAHVDALDTLLSGTTPVCTTPAVLQEILQGAKTRERQSAWRRQFANIPCLAFHDVVAGAVAAAEVYLACRVAGKTPRSSNDCLIACIAIEHDAQLLHHDRAFDAIARIEPRLRIYKTAA